jgi:hypothetical protein
MQVRIDNGAELGELHDVKDLTTTASFGDLLVKSGSVWTNSKTLTGSYSLSGSISLFQAAGVSGSNIIGTASYAETASYSLVSVQAITASAIVTFTARNNGTNLPAGTPVYITGSNGSNIIVAAAQAIDQSQTTELKNELAGVTLTAINGGNSGLIVTYGILAGINLSAYNAGDKVWVSKTAGQFTNIAPQAPFDRTFVGIVTKNTTNGEMFIDINQPLHFHDISSVSASLYTPGDLWTYEASASTGIWTNKKSLSGSYLITGSLVVSNSLTVVGTQTITGSLTVFTGSNVEFQVRNTGIKAGDRLTDSHEFTGSVGITGSFNVFTSLTNNSEFEVANTGVRAGNVVTDNHRITGSVGITGSSFSIFTNFFICFT